MAEADARGANAPEITVSELASALTEPTLEPLHNDSRWLPFLRRIGFAPEQLAKIDFKVTLPQ